MGIWTFEEKLQQKEFWDEGGKSFISMAPEKEREHIKSVENFSIVLTVPRWEIHATLTVLHTLMILSMLLNIQLIVSEHNKWHSHMSMYFIHLAPNATKPIFSLTLTILFPTSFIPFSCWLMQKGFENLFNYCPVAKKTEH